MCTKRIRSRKVAASHTMPPLSTQYVWVPGGTKNGELLMALAAENELNSPHWR